MNPSRSLLIAATCCASALMACHQPTPQEIAKNTSDRTSALVNEAAQTSLTANSVSSFKNLTTTQMALSGSSCANADGGCTTPQVPGDSFDAQLQQLSDFLQKRVFIDSNKESSDASSMTFLLHGRTFCSDGTTPADPICVSQIDQDQIRVKAILENDDGVDLHVLVGPDRAEIIELELTRTKIALTQDLGSAKNALVVVYGNEGVSTASLPSVMTGKHQLALNKNADHEFTLAYSVLADIDVELANAGIHSVFKTEAKSPLASLRISQPEQSVSMLLDIGQTTLVMPHALSNGTTTTNHKLAVSLSGLSGAFTAQAGQDAIVFTNLGLGAAQTTASLDDQQIFSVDLNSAAGRHFDLSLWSDTDGQALIKLTPEVAIGTFFNYSPLDTDPSAPISAGYKNVSYAFNFVGDGSVVLKALQATGTFPGGLKLAHGAFHASSSDATTYPNVDVAEGRCLTFATAPTSNPVLGGFAATACP